VIQLSTVARAAFQKVLPISAIVTAVGITPSLFSGGLSARAPLIAAGEMFCASVGYFLMLAIMRRKLDDDAPVNRRQSVVAGFVMPVALMAAFMLVSRPASVAEISTASLLTGAVVALTMFAPWLSRAKAIGAAGASAALDASSSAESYASKKQPVSHRAT
jgi:hypothetical protein